MGRCTLGFNLKYLEGLDVKSLVSGLRHCWEWWNLPGAEHSGRKSAMGPCAPPHPFPNIRRKGNPLAAHSGHTICYTVSPQSLNEGPGDHSMEDFCQGGSPVGRNLDLEALFSCL